MHLISRVKMKRLKSRYEWWWESYYLSVLCCCDKTQQLPQSHCSCLQVLRQGRSVGKRNCLTAGWVSHKRVTLNSPSCLYLYFKNKHVLPSSRIYLQKKSQCGFPNVWIKITVKPKAMLSNFLVLLNIQSDISCPYKSKGYKNRCTFLRIIS